MGKELIAVLIGGKDSGSGKVCLICQLQGTTVFTPAAHIPVRPNAPFHPAVSILPGGDAPGRTAGGIRLEREAADRTVWAVPPGQNAKNKTVCPHLLGRTAKNRTVLPLPAKKCETYSHTDSAISEQNHRFQSNSPEMGKNSQFNTNQRPIKTNR